MVDVTLVRCSCGKKMIYSNASTSDHTGIVHSSTYQCYDLAASLSKGSKMEFITHVRKPFVVQAIEITADNIEEIARYVGDLEHKEDGTPYILVDRRKVPNVARVYPGFFMTKMGEHVRVYSRKIFSEQFMLKDETVQPWLDFLDGKKTDMDGPTADEPEEFNRR